MSIPFSKFLSVDDEQNLSGQDPADGTDGDSPNHTFEQVQGSKRKIDQLTDSEDDKPLMRARKKIRTSRSRHSRSSTLSSAKSMATPKQVSSDDADEGPIRRTSRRLRNRSQQIAGRKRKLSESSDEPSPDVAGGKGKSLIIKITGAYMERYLGRARYADGMHAQATIQGREASGRSTCIDTKGLTEETETDSDDEERPAADKSSSKLWKEPLAKKARLGRRRPINFQERLNDMARDFERAVLDGRELEGTRTTIRKAKEQVVQSEIEALEQRKAAYQETLVPKPTEYYYPESNIRDQPEEDSLDNRLQLALQGVAIRVDREFRAEWLREKGMPWNEVPMETKDAMFEGQDDIPNDIPQKSGPEEQQRLVPQTQKARRAWKITPRAPF